MTRSLVLSPVPNAIEAVRDQLAALLREHFADDRARGVCPSCDLAADLYGELRVLERLRVAPETELELRAAHGDR